MSLEDISRTNNLEIEKTNIQNIKKKKKSLVNVICSIDLFM